MTTLEELQRDWEEFAHIDPLWAICSAPGRDRNRWNIEEFFKTGEKEIKHVLELVAHSGLSLKKRVALDFGCGVGRLTQALAQEFEKCYGVDISPQMIEYARKFNRWGDRCQYVINEKNHLHIFHDNFFDFIYTFIVLQHLPPELMKNYLREFVRILNPGGILVFQVPIQQLLKDKNPFHHLPIYYPARIANKVRWELQKITNKMLGDFSTRFYRLSKLGFSKRWLYHKFRIHPPVYMYYLSEITINELMTECNANIVNIVRDTHQEPGMLNAQFVVVKPA